MKALLICSMLALHNATPVHEFYSFDCCSGTHCHPVPCEEIKDVGFGWIWNGNRFFPNMLRDSPDGNCHICMGNVPYCIYLPPGT